MPGISSAQIRAIKARQRVLQLDDATYRGLLATRYEVGSCTELTTQQAHDLLAHLYGGPLPAGKRPRKRRKLKVPATPRPHATAGTVVHMVSPGERQFIADLVREIAWDTPDGYQRWLHRSLGLTSVLTSQDATAVIHGLKGLKRHGHAANDGGYPDAS